MNHTYIDEHQIADRYVMGTLPEEEASSFEDHSFTCPECLDRIELARSLRRGFQRVAREDAALLSSARQLAAVAWLARLGRSRQIGVLLIALVVLAVLPAGLSWRALSEGQKDTLREAERQHSEAVSRSAQKVAVLQAELEERKRELAREKEARIRTSRHLDQILRAPADVPTLYLEVERDAGPPAGEPTYQLRQPQILLNMAVDPSLSPYRAVLKNAQGSELLSRDGLRLGKDEILKLRVPASLLTTGDYTVAVQGTAPDGKPTPAGRFTFRILPPA
jgi:anti-sigma factor RsiW